MHDLEKVSVNVTPIVNLETPLLGQMGNQFQCHKQGSPYVM